MPGLWSQFVALRLAARLHEGPDLLGRRMAFRDHHGEGDKDDGSDRYFHDAYSINSFLTHTEKSSGAGPGAERGRRVRRRGWGSQPWGLSGVGVVGRSRPAQSDLPRPALAMPASVMAQPARVIASEEGSGTTEGIEAAVFRV